MKVLTFQLNNSNKTQVDVNDLKYIYKQWIRNTLILIPKTFL